jgi:hypothetical protein
MFIFSKLNFNYLLHYYSMAYLWFYKIKSMELDGSTFNNYPDKIHYHSAFP